MLALNFSMVLVVIVLTVLGHLPSPFGMDDLRAVKGSSYPDSTLRKTISRWRHDGWIEKMTRGL
jgi:hypothetical protein